MSTIDTIKVSPLAQAGICEHITLYGGRWTIHCDGQDVGDFLCMAPGEPAHVVTVHVDYHGTQLYGCTCNQETFYRPAPHNASCTHVAVVYFFLDLRVEVLAGALGRQVRWLRAEIRKRCPDLPTAGTHNAEREDRLTARVGELSFWLHQRRAARARLIPRRITEQQEQTEGASAPSLAALLRWPALAAFELAEVA